MIDIEEEVLTEQCQHNAVFKTNSAKLHPIPYPPHDPWESKHNHAASHIYGEPNRLHNRDMGLDA